MIFHGRFLTKHDGLSTDSLSRLKRSTTKRKVASERQLVSVEFSKVLQKITNTSFQLQSQEKFIKIVCFPACVLFMFSDSGVKDWFKKHICQCVRDS